MKLSFTAEDCLKWAVDEIIDEQRISKALAEGTVLNIKLGTDPTSPNLHLGRSIPIWRLRAFQELGHQIHIIIGDFTGQIGDTSDKDSERPMLTEEQVHANMATYEEQLWMILNPEKKDQVHFHYNSEWLSKLTFAEIGTLADVFSVNQFIKREIIAKRMQDEKRVSLREMLYPLMQGYDSLAIKADVELGGTDQRFNLLAGRLLQERQGLTPQSLIMNPLVSGTDGRKMSSSWGNVIALKDSPKDKFGKVMSIQDSLLANYLQFIPFSAQPFNETQLKERLASGENPRDLKLELASALVALYHGDDVALQEREAFISQFSQGQLPEEMEEVRCDSLPAVIMLLDLLEVLNMIPSRSEGRRLIEQNAVKVDQKTVANSVEMITVTPGMIIQVGKRRFVRLTA